MKLQETINELFATHPTVDVFYKTSDDQFFFEKPHADGHSQSLTNRGVAAVTRSQAVLPAVEAALPDNAIINPEATIPTAEELAEKEAADKTAQDALDAQLAEKQKADDEAAAAEAQKIADAEAAQKEADDKAAQDALNTQLAGEGAAAVVADEIPAAEVAKAKTTKVNPAGA